MLDPNPSLLAGIDSPAARRFLDALCRPARFAHHPTCACYDSHLLRIGNHSLCLGCTCAAIGAASAVVVEVAYHLCKTDWPSGTGVWQLIGIGVLLYLPTLGQFYVRRKPYKIVSRFLLGMAVVVLWWSAMTGFDVTSSGIACRVSFVGAFVVVYKVTQRLRNRFSENPCAKCLRGAFPLCADHLTRSSGLIEQLTREARPEDQPFVEFVLSVAGDGSASAIRHVGESPTRHP